MASIPQRHLNLEGVISNSTPKLESTRTASFTARTHASSNLGVVNVDEDTNAAMFRKYTNRFVDPAIEAEYDLFLVERYLKVQRIIIALLTVFLGGIVICDGISWDTPEYLEWDTPGLFVFIVGNFVLSIKWCQKYAQFIVTFLIVGGLGFTLLGSSLFGLDSIGWDGYYGGVLGIAIAIICTGCHVKIFYAFVACSLLVVLYILSFISLFYNIFLWYHVVTIPWSLVFVFTLCLFCGIRIERLSRESFLNTHILKMEEQKLKWSKERDESLLRNIFPAELGARLKDISKSSKEHAVQQQVQTPKMLICQEYPNVTVLMADIVGFTTMSSRISAKDVVEILNYIFSIFDNIAKDSNVEKIRTLGDAYLAVANMTYPVETHQERILLVAKRMIECLPHIRKTFPMDPPLSLRIGVGSGPLLGGIMGTTKWNYDIIGDTVNNTFTLEAASSPGRVTVSQSVVDALPKGKYSFETVSPIPIDTKGNPMPGFMLINDFEAEDISTPLPGSLTSRPFTAKSHVKVDSYDKRKQSLEVLYRVSQKELRAENLEVKGPFKSLIGSSYYINLINQLRATEEIKQKQLEFKDLADTPEVLNDIQLQVEDEMKAFSKRVVLMQFQNPELERDYKEVFSVRTHSYSTKLTFWFLLLLSSWIIDDTLAPRFAREDVPNGLWISHGISFAATIFMFLFVRSNLFHKPWAHWVCAITLGTICMLEAATMHFTVEVYYYFPTYRAQILLMYCFVNIRVPQKFLWAIALGLTSSAMAYASEMQIKMEFVDIIASILTCMLFITMNAIACLANLVLQKGMRKDYLMAKALECQLVQIQKTTWRSKLLLYNILPRSIAKRLPETQHIADSFLNCTVCFVYIKLGDLISHPLKLFAVLNDIFTLFDELAVQMHCEKIKTINTTYMLASGVPKTRSNHCSQALHLVKAMFNVVQNYQCSFIDPNTSKPYKIELRVGVATGPIIAGVIGKIKYAYDIWSDTVNTSSRMESTGIDGYIQVTEDVYNTCRQEFPFQKRGTIYVKGKGEIPTYLLPASTPNA